VSLRLILMRHAKSSWADSSRPDHDRPLNTRGQRSAEALGRWLKSAGYHPEQALCSTATRTRETLSGLGLDTEAAFLPALYHAREDTMLKLLQQHGTHATVLMLGHNPGVAFFAQTILAEPPMDDSFRLFPTGATAVIDFECNTWAEVRFGCGRLQDFTVPRALLG